MLRAERGIFWSTSDALARRALENPAINVELATQISETIDQIVDATLDEDDAQVQAYCDDLIDLLFDVEE
mgnify:CR=1 FL=1